MYAIKIIHFHGLLLILFLQLSDRKFSIRRSFFKSLCLSYFDRQTIWGFKKMSPKFRLVVTIHSQPKPVKWKTKEIVFV